MADSNTAKTARAIVEVARFVVENNLEEETALEGILQALEAGFVVFPEVGDGN